ncbi:MAG: PilZ domain-containing protein [Fibromonadales bacterium]|nr:PilZ domain-containing protein [Fibromonadales bacterium]
MRKDSISNYDIWSESFRQWADKDLSMMTILIVVAIIMLLVTAIVLYEIHRSNKAKRDLRDLGWKKFEYNASRLNLSHSNIAALKEIAQEADLQDPDSMIKSPHVFESALEKYYKRKRIESLSSAKLAEIRNLRKVLDFLPLSKEIAYISTRQFSPGEKCIVQIPDTGPATHKGMCQIISSDELRWVIARPQGPEVAAGTWMRMNLTRPGDAEYTFRTQVLRDLNGELVLNHAIQLNRAQQRNWVRIDVSIPVEVTQMYSNGAGDIFFGKIIDMSGGGFGMALPIKLLYGSNLKLSFELPGHGHVDNLLVKVVRVAGQYNNDASKTVHSVAFEGDVRVVQEQIIQYVFEKQRQDSLLRRS